MKIDPRFKDTEFVVEADSYAMQSLWERHSTQAMFPNPKFNTIRWEQDSMGLSYTIGKLDNRPIAVSFFWSKLNSHLILFYHPTSQIVDHLMVEDWLKKYCNPQWDGNRRAHADASNFHHVLDYIKNCEAKQLLDEATAHAEAGNPDDAAHLLTQLWTQYPYRYKKEGKKVADSIKGMKGHPGINLNWNR